MASPPWAASPGGPYGSSPPKFVVPWKKSLSLTKHKGETPRPSPEKARVGGGGRPEAPERGGWAGLRAEKVARAGVTSAAAVAARLQQPACSLKSFALKSGEEKLLLSLRQVEDKKKKKKNTKRARRPVLQIVLPPRSLESLEEGIPTPQIPGDQHGSRCSKAWPVQPSGAGSLPVICSTVHLSGSTCLLPGGGGFPHPTPTLSFHVVHTLPCQEKVNPSLRGPQGSGVSRIPHQVGSVLCGCDRFSTDRPFSYPARRLRFPTGYHLAPAPLEITAGCTGEPGKRAYSWSTQTKWKWGL